MMAVAVFLQEDVVLPVSAVGGGVGVLVVGVAWHVTGCAGHDYLFKKKGEWRQTIVGRCSHCAFFHRRGLILFQFQNYFLAARVVRVRRRSVSILRTTRLRRVGVLEPWLVARELGVACHDWLWLRVSIILFTS